MIKVEQGYLPQGCEQAGGASHILLVYYGHYDQQGSGRQGYGEWTKEKFLPYVGYAGLDGEPIDFFFDTFLFIALRTPNHRNFHRYYDWVRDSQPGKMKDWQWALDRLFLPNQQLEALDAAAAETGRKLGKPDYRVKVIVMMPFPEAKLAQFGDVNGDGVEESLDTLENRNLAVKWYIDSFLQRFEQRNYKHLEIIGFYWAQEDVDPGVPGEVENIRFTSEYLHQKQLKLGWIPWWGAIHKGEGKRFFFDFTIMQPNHYYHEQSTEDRIRECAELAYRMNQGMEIEMDAKVVTSKGYRQAFYRYLHGGRKYGYMQHSLLAFYQDVQALYELYTQHGALGRRFYDDIYLFIKNKYGSTIPFHRRRKHVLK